MYELTQRQLSLLVAFPTFIIIAIILGILILRRDPKYWGNRFFFLSFICNALALLFNLLYLFSYDHLHIIILNLSSINSINVGIIFMVLAILVLYKGENEVIQNKSTYFFIVGAVVSLIVLSLLPGGVSTQITSLTPLSIEPHWALYFGIYELVFTQILFIVIFIYSIKLYREISQEMKRKFKRFLLATVFIDITFLSVCVNNMRIIPNYELIAGVLNLGAFIGIILIYYGIVRRS